MIKNLSKYFQGDTGIWIAVLFLLLVSFPVLYSTSGELKTVEVPHTVIQEDNGKTISIESTEKKVIVDTPIRKHITFIVMAVIVMILIQRTPPFLFFRFGQVLIYIAWILLVYTLVAGKNIGDARRWISVGGMTFQTSEIAKIALVMYIAQYLSFFQGEIKPGFREFKHLLLYTGITCALIITENFSTAIIIFFVATIIMYIGGVSWKYLTLLYLCGILFGIFILGFGHTLNFSRAKTWQSRIYNKSGYDVRISERNKPAPWLTRDENSNKLTEGDHISLAIHDAGLMGVGVGNSKHKDYLGAASSDYIYTIIIEEQGIIFWFATLMAYLFILFRAALIAQKTKRSFWVLLTLGCALDIVSQAFANMAVGSSLFPITGQTLPFVSMGGTSMLLNSAPAIGMILSVAYYSKLQLQKEKEKEQALNEESELENETNETISENVIYT